MIYARILYFLRSKRWSEEDLVNAVVNRYKVVGKLSIEQRSKFNTLHFVVERYVICCVILKLAVLHADDVAGVCRGSTISVYDVGFLGYAVLSRYGYNNLV